MSDGRVSSLQFSIAQMLSMQLQQGKLYKSMEQLSSGKKYSSPADNPNAADRLFRTQQQKDFIATYKDVTNIANSYLAQEDAALGSIEETLDLARQTVIKLNNGMLSANDANTLAYELQSLLDQLVSQANANQNGRYLFSGSKNCMPVAQDVNGNYVYQGDQQYQQGTIADNVSIQLNDTALDVFFQLPTDDLNLNGFAGRAAVTANNPGLVNPGVLTAAHSLVVNELEINGLDIAAATASSDALSSSDNIASALAITTAMNKSDHATNVTAYYSNNVLNFTSILPGYVDHNFVAGEFKINGVDITGDTTPLLGATVVDRLVLLVNNTFTDKSVVATNNAGNLCLTSIDGRNMQISSTGGNPGNLALAGFNFAAGDNKVQRADITLKSDQAINLATNTFIGTANAIGFAPGTYNVANNTGTAVMSAPIVRDTNTTANTAERYFINFVSPTTYNVYRESDPFTPIPSFKVYHAGEIYEKNAKDITLQPATYTAGDRIVIDGIEVSITGVPAAGDNFTIDKEPKPSTDIFSALKDTIYAAKNYKGENTRYNYNMNTALKNIENALYRATDIHGMVGIRMKRIKIEEDANDRFNLLASTDMSALMDVDFVEASQNYAQATSSLEASQKIIARTNQLSLFNFL